MSARWAFTVATEMQFAGFIEGVHVLQSAFSVSAAAATTGVFVALVFAHAASSTDASAVHTFRGIFLVRDDLSLGRPSVAAFCDDLVEAVGRGRGHKSAGSTASSRG